MKKSKNLIALLSLLALLLALSACAIGGNDDTPSTTVLTETGVITETTESTVPPETKPQLQFQDRESNGEPLTAAQLQEVFSVITESDPNHWYETIFIQNFTDPREIDFFLLFGDGIPGEQSSVELTPEEQDFFIQIGKESVLYFDVSRIPREVVESVLCTYFELNTEELEQMNIKNRSDVPYFSETDCFYGLNNGYNGDTPHFQEGYRMEDGTIVIYYYRYRTRVTEGILCRAVIQVGTNADSYKILQIAEVSP